MKVKTMPIWMIFLLSVKTGFGLMQRGTCRPFCTGSDCVTVNQEMVDFKTAKEECHEKNGELMTFQTEKDGNILDILSKESYGNFWIGLSLPAGICSNLSAPLRGYKWASGRMQNSSVLSLCTWNDNFKVCSPHCVSISNDRRLTERLCTDRTDGYLCKMKHKDACQIQRQSDSNFYKSSKGCSNAPCEHLCTAVGGGYKCSCFNGYIPDSINPKRCELHCSQEKCPAICQRNTDSACECPKGYLAVDKFCVDFDECSMEWCDQKCNNTFGSFKCSCEKGFILKDEVKCIKAAYDEHFVVTTPIIIGFVKPATNNHTNNASSTAGGFLWIWIFLALAVVVFIAVIRFYVVKYQRGRAQNTNQQFTVPSQNIEC
ncbi:thrombomodulin [Xyrichtys novacula]|uniref:Thrombomodulin n=1 Tax=Xyrichtys novacula TaxID=13765 RepID=A0AAV1GPD8_XYRNO|nr:thrombomodulin [Xyrichtys novacula]